MDLSFDGVDRDGSHRLCIDDPLFIFGPDNPSNRPVPGVHEIAINFWPIYPKSLHDLFTQVFTRGLRDPEARVMDNDWRKEMCRRYLTAARSEFRSRESKPTTLQISISEKNC